MTLPLYFLRRLAMPSGHRLPKMAPTLDIAGTCPTCGKPVIREYLIGALQLNGMYRSGEFFHYQCVPRMIQSWRETKPAAAVDPGNLNQEEYRFWIGYRGARGSSSWAMCRCCRTDTYSSKERADHFMNDQFKVGGNACTTRLTNAYKLMLSQSICIICKRSRYTHEKWGVPICADSTCLNAWKFSHDRWIALELQLELQRKKAQFMAKNTMGIVSIGEAGAGKEYNRPWCDVCHMFADNAGHLDIHTAHVLSGELLED